MQSVNVGSIKAWLWLDLLLWCSLQAAMDELDVGPLLSNIDVSITDRDLNTGVIIDGLERYYWRCSAA